LTDVKKKKTGRVTTLNELAQLSFQKKKMILLLFKAGYSVFSFGQYFQITSELFSFELKVTLCTFRC